ncbi:O-antigen ligase family protein [Ancylobacter terrae]|uniref:O-antigen ligase family protein n=1 Tax=Ancylobacter sp. sgz301288 TaxID=3342077 RepID=UPI00385A88D6
MTEPAPVHTVTTIGWWVFPFCLLAFVVALFFGGGQVPGRMPDAVVQLASLPLLVIVVGTLMATPPRGALATVIVFCVLIFLLPMAQLIPLPPSLWAQLPGRESVAAIYDLVGMERPPLPLSLSPLATAFSAYSLVPSLAIFLACLLMSRKQINYLLMALMAYGLFSLILALTQLAFPVQSLRTYNNSEFLTDATGLFTGRNNLAALFYSVLPITIALTAMAATTERRHSSFRYFYAALGAIVCLLFFLGILMARSRAGLLLGLAGAFATLAAVLLSREGGGGPRHWKTAIIVAAFVVVSGLFVLDVGFYRIAGRLSQNVADDLRWPIFQTTWKALQDFLPFGSGFGTFVPIFMEYEGIGTLDRYYVNHAHNDWIEVVFEGGIPAAILTLAGIAYLLRCIVKAERSEMELGDRHLFRAALVVIAALLIHTGFEYPLRTQALMAVMAVMLAIVVRPHVAADAAQRARRRRPNRSARSVAPAGIQYGEIVA